MKHQSTKSASVFFGTILSLFGLLLFSQDVVAKSWDYYVDFSGNYVSGLSNSKFYSFSAGNASISASYYLDAPKGSPNTRNHEVGVELKYSS